MEDSTQTKEAEANPSDGDNSNEDLDFDSLFSEDEGSEEAFLGRINKIEGKQYKTVEAWAKTNMERKKVADKFHSEKGRENKDVKKDETKEVKLSTNDKRDERLLKLENPDAKHVMEDLRDIAKQKGVDIFDAWENFGWIRKEAKARAEDETEKDKNGKKISKPSSKISGTGGGENLSSADRAFLSRTPGLLEKHIKSKQ